MGEVINPSEALNTVPTVSVYVHISSTSTKKSCNNRVSYDLSRLVAIDLFHTHHAQILVGKKGSRIHKTPILRLNFSLSDSISSEKLLELRSSWRWHYVQKMYLSDQLLTFARFEPMPTRVGRNLPPITSRPRS